MKKIINGIFVGLGFLFVGLGALGIALPLLPATPFLILATICFAKGSEKFHKWFIKTKLYLKYVKPAVKNKEMDKKAKIKILITLAIIFTVSFMWVPIWHARVAIALVAVFHFYYFIFKIKTVVSPVDVKKNENRK